MLSPRWRKVVRDLWSNKTRTVLVVLSIAVGVFAVGVVAGSRAILEREFKASYLAVNPAHASLYTEPFDDELVQVVRDMPGVADAEGRRSLTVRVKVGPDEWKDLQLFAIADYEDIRINKVRPVSGAWPPPEHELLLERTSLGVLKTQIGNTIVMKLPDGKEREMRVAGTAYDLNQFPSAFSGTGYGYVTFDTIEWLGEPRNFNELSIVVAGEQLDKARVAAVAGDVRRKIEKSGRSVFFTWLPEPGRHPANDFLQPMLMLLGAIGLLSVVASGFLVVNTISALLTQQVRQIGVMKAIGARNGQIMAMYLGTVLIFGLLSLGIAVPLGALGARGFSAFMAGLMNTDLASFRIPAHVVALEVAIGLVAPLLAGIWPVVAGTRVTVREAISSYGLGKGHFGQGALDRFLEGVRGLSRPLLLSLRNTFRRKGRLALTLTTLTLSGIIFISVFSVRDSLLLTLDKALEYWKYDIGVNLSRPYRVEALEREALQVPGVVAAESWGFASARRVRPDDAESDAIFVFAPPAETELLVPTMTQGRWLLPDDDNALVVSTEFLKTEKDVRVGDEITLSIDGRESDWRVVGIVRVLGAGSVIYANAPYFERVVRSVGRASGVQVVTEQHEAAFQAQVAKALEEQYDRKGLHVSSTQTTSTLREQIEFQFNIIVIFLLLMATLLATVGGLGLMGTMSINVLERTREIGVLRAIGASDGAVLRIVIVEGVLIGLLSWLVGASLSLPLSKLLSAAVGYAFIQTPLDYSYSVPGALLWLAVVTILSGLASFLPAWNASRVSVREVLAYE